MSDLGDDLGNEPEAGAPAAGAPPAGPSVDDLKGENAGLRAENRRLNAEALAAKHGLTPTESELLGMIPKDQQEAKATALAEERKAAGITPPAPSGDPAPTEPENADQLAAMQDGGTPPPTTPPAPAGSEADLLKRLDGAASYADVRRIQDEERARLIGQG